LLIAHCSLLIAQCSMLIAHRTWIPDHGSWINIKNQMFGTPLIAVSGSLCCVPQLFTLEDRRVSFKLWKELCPFV